jgi:MFS family permease
MYTYQPVLSPYLKSIGVSYSMIGVIGGSYGFTQMLLRVPVGILSDRTAMRKVFIIAGIITASVSSVILYITGNPAVILMGRGLAGVAASSWVVFTVLYSGYFPPEKSASKISFLTMHNVIGQTSAMLIGGLAAGWLGYKFPFLLGAASGAASLIFAFSIKEKKPAGNERVTVPELLKTIKDKDLIIMSSFAVLSQFVFFGSVMTFTPIVAANLGASAEMIGYLSTLGNVPRVFSSLICGILFSKKADAKKLMILSFIFLCSGCISAPLCENIYALYAVNVITGFGAGISITVLLSLCTRGVPEKKRSAAMGFFQAIYGAGMFLGPMAVGYIADASGIRSGFWFSAAVSLTGVIGSLIYTF